MAGLPISTNLEVWVRRLDNRFGSEIFLIRRVGAGRIESISLSDQRDHSGAPMWKSSMIDTPEGYAFASDMKCFLSCDEVMLRELFMAFTKYADEQGIPRPSEDHLKGKLEATEKHLQDLQNQVQMLMHQNGRLMALVEGDKDGTNRSDQGVGNTPHRLTEQME